MPPLTIRYCTAHSTQHTAHSTLAHRHTGTPAHLPTCTPQGAPHSKKLLKLLESLKTGGQAGLVHKKRDSAMMKVSGLTNNR